MNRILLTLIGFFLLVDANAQIFQGTIKPGSTSTSVVCAIKPSTNYSDKVANIQFTIAVPQSVGTRPTMSIMTNNYSAFFNTIALFQTALYGTDYIYLINMSVPTLTTTKNYTTNTEDIVAEISFAGNVGALADIRLLQLPNGITTSGAGSENGNYNFYTEFATGSDKTNQTAMFYTTTGGTVVNSPLGYGGYSSVSAGTNLLPLKWIGFWLQRQNGNALIKWEVANQIDIDYFEVEMSNDGRNFSHITKVISTEKNVYSYQDLNFSKQGRAFVYYRIKQVDKDGKFTYTETKKLPVYGKEFSFEIVGNPVKGNNLKIGIESTNNAKGTLKIFDVNGKQVYHANIQWSTGYTEQVLHLPILSQGTYIANLITISNQYLVKFIR